MTGFKKAERYLTNPTIALTGPTGSGKTFSGLRLATGIAKALGKRIAVIDAENGSASLYSEFFDFDTMNLTPPFTTEKYIEAIGQAEKAGYGVILIDSITHAWAGEGGLLEQKAQLDSRPNTNHWTNWNPIKAKDLKFKNAYLHSSIPFLIATMRSKMEYAQSESDGKKKVQKVGMAPVQSDGIEYEFSIVFDIAMNHEAEVSKDRTHLFDKNNILQIIEETGEALVKWRAEGKQKQGPQAAKTPPAAENIPQDFPSDDAQFHAEDDLDAALGPSDHQIASEYVIKFGQFKGRALKTIEPTVLRSYCIYLEDEAAAKGKEIDPNGPVGQLMDKALLLLGPT